MEYRGKHFSIVQGIGPNSFKWKVRPDERTVRSGEATTRSSARISVVWAIDKALVPKKINPVSPLD
jgi:hypothetical protein